jgi:hypothetical protein
VVKSILSWTSTVVVLTLAFAAGPAAAFTFTDNFSPPSPLWSNSSGNWTASSGDYYAQQPNNNPEAWSYLPFVFTNASDQMTVTVNNLGDGGILFLAPNNSDYLLNVDGGAGYGQGDRGGDAGNSAYWATAADPSATFNLMTGVFTPGDTYTLTIKVTNGTFALYNGATELTSFSDPGLTRFKIGLYDDQPNTTTGSGSGAVQSFSDFSVSGSTTVPELSTWAMMAPGFSGLGYAAYRRRRQNAPRFIA